MDKKGGAGDSITIFGSQFVASQYQKFTQGNPLVFHYFGVSKNFLQKRAMSRPSLEKCSSHSTKTFVGEPFCV